MVWHRGLTWEGFVFVSDQRTSVLTIFCQVAMACFKSSFVSSHLLTRALRFSTAASANPFDSGLYGDNSCMMSLLLQNSANFEWNCGPPSEQILLGNPYSKNRLFRVSIMCREVVLVKVKAKHSLSSNRRQLATFSRIYFPSNRSTPKLFIGEMAADGAVPVTGVCACEGECLRQILQSAMKVFRQFFMPGQ